MVHMMSSAKGVLALLRDTDNGVILFALKRLVDLMDTFWCEVAPDLTLIEELHESANLSEETRKLAALVASHVYFHLGALDDSVHYALAAGNAFDGAARSLFTDTILSRCIDQYVAHQERQGAATTTASSSSPAGGALDGRGGGNEEAANGDDDAAAAALDPRLETLFVSLTKSWILANESQAEIKEIVGFTIRARRLDFLERVLKQSLARTHNAEMLNFTFHVANVLLKDITFRRSVLRLLANLYTEALATVDYFAMAQCLLFLQDVQGTASVITGLLKGGDQITAFQLAFDLFQYGSQDFLSALVKELSPAAAEASPAAAAAGAAGAEGAEEEERGEGGRSGAPSNAADGVVVAPAADDDTAKLLSVLSGTVTTRLHMQFLYTRCAADIHILNQVKTRAGGSKSTIHIATLLANAFMYRGTTIDDFLRYNPKWMAKATHWAQFISTASTGVVHQGSTDIAMELLQQHFPEGEGAPSQPHQTAGAMYALGLIHAPLGTSSDRKTVDFLADKLRKYSGNSALVHGASLGLGLAAMGLRDEELSDALLACAGGSDAVDGEGATVALGLLMMGSGNPVLVEHLKNMACEETQKEKIIRGAVMAIALTNLGREREAVAIANELLESGDPWVRLGGCFVLGLAFAGTDDAMAIERLLQTVVRDTADDVRRNAAIMVGFVTFKSPALCVDLTRIMIDSYNPHVRYGVAMALGVAAAGTGSAEVINILWEMKDDLVELVRQGVYIALSMVMVQLTEVQNPKVKEFRQLLHDKIGDRREDACTKFGCIVATGLLDAGGRNCTFAMHRDRHRLDKAVVGMFLFTQYWYWYPYALMISLAMQPTCFIGLNDKLEMPEYAFKSKAKPSTFAPPKSVRQEKKEARATGVQAVVLSTTRKEEALQRKRGKTGAAGSGGASAGAAGGADGGAAGDDEGSHGAAGEEAAEASFEVLHNPARVTAHQLSVIDHTEDGRYTPLKPNAHGVCLLRDNKPELGEQKLVERVDVFDKEAPPPAPFSYP